MSQTSLPVAVIGAGPIGLAAAAHLVSRGETPLILEAGASVGASILTWGHVRVFSPWRYVVDHVSASLLERSGWASPPVEGLPTGGEFVEGYLKPLAELPEIAPRLRLNTKVVSVARQGFDKMKTAGREEAPFVLRVSSTGIEQEILAKAVIDASGTYSSPNPLGGNGVPAIGEADAADRIVYGIPDVLGSDRDRYAGRRVMVVGSGHSAFNTLIDLGRLADEAPSTRITWVVRRADMRQLFGGEANDMLPARGLLGTLVRKMVEAGSLTLVAGFKVHKLARTPDGIVVSSLDRDLPPVDEIIGATGFRPDLSLLSELRVDLDPSVEAPSALAPLIDPNVHSCGSVPPHGEAELRHPEAGFYVVGMKSYGRAPTFLMLTGYEQVRSVVAAIVGDMEAARNVELVLPETGVCSTDLTDDPPSPNELPVLAGVGGGSSVCCR
ncbi:MAG TPA: NAD(P)-binding domain-containing protein [Chloroflexota bacterium]|nr:NAD(P)-binding domain-containing protein [Chloroflexota bacterium]